uniref:EF-hand domain-containing protein n=1 Tax=Macrostomum lignano TaxID=282301 RepID=A0A1I8F5Q0_9PLAT
LHIVMREGRQSVGTVGPLHPQVVRHGNKEAVLHTEHALLRALLCTWLWNTAAMIAAVISRTSTRPTRPAYCAIWGGTEKQRIERLQECRQGHPAHNHQQALGLLHRAAAAAEAHQQGEQSQANQNVASRRHRPALIGYRAYVTLIGSLGDLLMNLNRSFLLTATQMPRPKLAMPNMKKATLKMKRIILAREVLQPMLTVVLAIRLANQTTPPVGSQHGQPDRADHEVWAASRWASGRTPAGLTGSQSTRSPRDSPLSKSNGCWLRFQQLGCTSEGLITNEVLRKRSMYSEDTFLRKFIGYLRDDFRSDGKDTVRQILPKIIENDSEQGYDRLADTLMEQLAGSGTEGGGVNAAESYISQDSFVQYCLDRIPKSRLEALLAFNVIPRHVSDQARQELERAEADGGRRQPAQAAAAPEAQVDAAEAVYTVPTDAQLAVVAQRASRRTTGCSATSWASTSPPTAAGRRRPLLQRRLTWRRRRTPAAGGLRTAAAAKNPPERPGGGGDSGSDESSSWCRPPRRRCWSAGFGRPGALRLLLARPGVLEPHLGDALVQLGPLRDLLQVGAVGVVVEVEGKAQLLALFQKVLATQASPEDWRRRLG